MFCMLIFYVSAIFQELFCLLGVCVSELLLVFSQDSVRKDVFSLSEEQIQQL